MRVIASAIIAAAFIISGLIAVLWRYDVEAASRSPGGAKYLLLDRWTRRSATCIRTESGADPTVDPAVTECEAWTPIAGGKP